MKKIATKRQCAALARAGAFGMKWPVWATLEELWASDYCGPVAIRYQGAAGGGPCSYDIPYARVWAEVNELVALGWQKRRLYYNASPDIDDKLVLQGEYLNEGAGYLFYSRLKTKMRIALSTSATGVLGMRARMLMRGAMTPSSWADFEVLCEQYPGHVIEFSVWRLTITPGRNTMFWEVRAF